MEIIVGLLHDQKLLCCFEYSRVSCPELAKMLYIETDEVINEHSYMPKHINFVYLIVNVTNFVIGYLFWRILAMYEKSQNLDYTSQILPVINLW